MANIHKGFDIVYFIDACDWDATGRIGIERMAFTSGELDDYFGVLAEVQDSCEILKPVVKAIGGFLLE